MSEFYRFVNRCGLDGGFLFLVLSSSIISLFFTLLAFIRLIRMSFLLLGQRILLCLQIGVYNFGKQMVLVYITIILSHRVQLLIVKLSILDIGNLMDHQIFLVL